MSGDRLAQAIGLPNPQFVKLGATGNINDRLRDAYMLDTSAGQLTMFAATAKAFGVPINSLQRRVEPGYSPFDDDLRGFEMHLDEFENSTSPEETRLIKQMIENNLDLRRNLEDYGGTRFLTGLLDPINLIPVPFALGKGFAEGAKVALKRGTPIIAGTELTRHAIDPTSTWGETTMNTLGGTLFMGLIGGAVGKIPKNTITVSEALNKLTPPAGTTMMFGGMPWGIGSAKGAWGRVKNAIKSTASSGEPSWKKVDPDDVHMEVDEFGGSGVDRIVRIIHNDSGEEILTGVVRDGRIEVAVGVPEALRRRGLASYAIREAAMYAEKNGLTVASHGTVSPDAIQLWKFFESQGVKVKENPNFKLDSEGNRVSLDDQPLFEAVQQIDPEAKQIPKEVRDDLNSLERDYKQSEMELKVLDEAVKLQKEKVKNAPVAGGAKTKAKNALEELLKTQNETAWKLKRQKSAFDDLNVKAAQMLDEATIKDWDLLPTGYNKLLGKLDQFPWWTLMKTPFRELAPDLAVKYQMFALKMAATPGLNNAGNRLGSSTGPSVEALTIEYTGKWLAAARKAQTIYRKYAGYGETSSQVKHFMVDQAQRVRSTVNRAAGGEPIKTTSDGKLTIEEFNKQISIAIADNGKHTIPEVAEAAADYVRVLKEIGDEGKRLEVFATQRNILRRIAKKEQALAEFDEKWGLKYNVTGDQDVQLNEAGQALLDEFNRLNSIILGDAYTNTKPTFVPDHVTKLKDGVNDVYIDDAITPRDGLRSATGVDTPSRVEVLKNPTRTSLARWAGRDVESVRFAVDTNGDLYVWDANLMLHETFRQATDVGAYSNTFFDITIEPKRLFDAFEESLSSRLFDGQETSGDILYPKVFAKEIESTAYFKEVNQKLGAAADAAPDKDPLPPPLQATRDAIELEKMQLEEMNEKYKLQENEDYVHRMWDAEQVIAQADELKTMIRESFLLDPLEAKTGKKIDIDVLNARVEEAYASILHDAETGGDSAYAPNSTERRNWLEARLKYLEDNPDGLPSKQVFTQQKIIERKLERIEAGHGITGASGPLIARRLDLDDKKLIEMGLTEGNVDTWMNHYVMRTAPMIETARVFGDPKAQKAIDDLFYEVYERAQAETNPAKQAKMLEEAERAKQAMIDLRDIVHGVYQIPEHTDAITPRLLRILRNFNILGAMGRSVLMAMGDMGNVIVSQGFVRSLGHAVESFAGGLTDGNIKMIKDEVDLAGSVSEVILGMRYHQMTDFGAAVGYSSKAPKWFNKLERGMSNASQRFFLYNLLGPWTDMARRFSGGMLQSRLIENSRLWKAGQLGDDQIEIMTRLGINKEQAIQFVNEWEASGGLKHKSMFIANTSQWVSEQAVRTFRAAMNTEINRMVPTPGAVDKPKALLKSEWWKVIGQYRGFSIAATHRIMGAGIHTKGKTKWAGMASMVGIAMTVDALKRPDYIQMPIEEQLLRAVELSGVTGIILDLNDTIERASAGTIGLRPALGMDIRERNPNWANRMGTIGAVPNQWLTLMYGLTSDEATTNDLARGIRYMIPYNNLLWWNEAFNRGQRAAVDTIEDFQE